MKINNLTLRNYRNHHQFKTNFDSKLTVIEGQNSAGKSNILEAVNLLSTGKSMRAKYDRDMIEYGTDFATIQANVDSNDDNFDLEIQIIKSDVFENAASKKVKVNKVPKTIQTFSGYFNSVLFTPEDIQLLIGSPSERRKYIDLMLMQVDREYKEIHTHYLKALKQRNKLLESIHKENIGRDQLDFWTEKILTKGTAIQAKRTAMFEQLSKFFLDHGNRLENNNSNLELIYKMNEISEMRLWEYKHKEVLAESTLVGPHRDDFEIFYNGKNIGQFGSRGQQRSIVLALKLAEIDFISKETGQLPTLLLDDIFSELDEKHKKAVLDVIDNQQTIITSAEKLNFFNNDQSQLILLEK